MLTDIDKASNFNQITANNPSHTPTLELIKELYNQPFNDLVFKARLIHIENFNPNSVQLSTLVNIKVERVQKIAPIVPRASVIKQMFLLPL